MGLKVDLPMIVNAQLHVKKKIIGVAHHKFLIQLLGKNDNWLIAECGVQGIYSRRQCQHHVQKNKIDPDLSTAQKSTHNESKIL